MATLTAQNQNDLNIVSNALGMEPSVEATQAATRLIQGIAAGTLPWNQAAIDVYSAATGGQARPIDRQVEGSPILYTMPNPSGKNLEMLSLVKGPGGYADLSQSGAWEAQTAGQALASAAGNVLGVVGGALAPGLAEALGGGLLGTIGSGAILGGTTSGLKGDGILKGAITGGAAAYGISQLDNIISDVAGLDVKGSDAYNATITAQRVADAGGSLADVQNSISTFNLPADKVNSIIADAISGAQTIAPSLTDTLSQGAVNITGTGGLNTNLGSALTTAATGLLTGDTGANNVVNVTAKTPEQLQAEALAATLAGSTITNTGGTGANTGAVTVTGAKGNDIITGLGGLTAQQIFNSQYPGSSQTITGAKGNDTISNLGGLTAQQVFNSQYPGNTNTVTVTGAKGNDTINSFVNPTTGLLTAAGLTALNLSSSGATSLNNTGADTTTGSSLTDLLAKYGPSVLGLLGSGLSTANAYSAGQKAQDIFNTQASTLGTAAKAAAPGYQFSPIGMTTAFGKATPTFDVNGKLISYDYAATPAVAAQRDALMKLSSQALPTTTNPTDIVNNYISQQQGLLAPGQAQDLARLQAQMAATGRSGLGTGAVAGTSISPALAATNPQLAAYYNSLAQQNQQIAANAPTYAQNLLNAQIGTSGTLFGQAQTMETAAQQPLAMGQQLGQAITAGTTNASNAAYKAAQDAALLQAQGAAVNLNAQTEAQKALISQLSGSSSGSSGLFSSLLNAGVDIAKLIPSFFGSGVTTVGTPAAVTTTGTTTPTTTTKLLGGGTTVVNGGVNNASNTLQGGGGLITADQYGINNASNALAGGGGLITAAQYGVNNASNTFPSGGGLITAAQFGTGAQQATEAQVRAAYQANPKARAANPFGPDAAAINYWKQQGLGNFNQVVAGL